MFIEKTFVFDDNDRKVCEDALNLIGMIIDNAFSFDGDGAEVYYEYSEDDFRRLCGLLEKLSTEEEIRVDVK